MAARGVTGSMDSPAFPALPVMASKAPQGTQATQAPPGPRAFQEKGVLRDSACRAPKASVASPEIPDYLDHQASPALPAPRASQDK